MGSVSDRFTLHLGDCRDVLATLPPDSHDVCVSDPPYADETHSGARTGAHGSFDATGQPTALLATQFSSIPFPDLRDTLGLVGTVTRRWIVITCDWRHAAKLSESPPAGLRFVRFGVWVKPNGAPQFTGDRPGPGWEAVAWLHREGAPLKWNGGGRSSVFTEPKISGQHPTTKPLPLIRQFVALTSDGGPVLDPWMGSGTVGVAAVERGLEYTGIECDPTWHALAQSRVSGAAAQLSLFPNVKAKQESFDL